MFLKVVAAILLVLSACILVAHALDAYRSYKGAQPGRYRRTNLEVTRSRPRRSAQSLMAYLADREPPPTNRTWKDAPGPLTETDGRGSSRKDALLRVIVPIPSPELPQQRPSRSPERLPDPAFPASSDEPECHPNRSTGCADRQEIGPESSRIPGRPRA